MVAKEKAVLLEEFGPKPVLAIVTQCVTLAVFSPRGVLRNDIECELDDGGQPLAGVLLDVARRVFLLQGLDLMGQTLNLGDEQRVHKNRPAMNAPNFLDSYSAIYVY